MRKYWKLRYDSDIEKKLKFINVDSLYTKIILEEDSDFMKYVKPGEYVYILLDSNDNSRFKYGWCECDDWGNEHIKKYGFEYCGEISFRKDKLKKLFSDGRLECNT